VITRIRGRSGKSRRVIAGSERRGWLRSRIAVLLARRS
jgi:hypothetical protein